MVVLIDGALVGETTKSSGFRQKGLVSKIGTLFYFGEGWLVVN